MTQAFVQMSDGRRGRPFREEQDLPPQIQQALVLRAAGASWIDCAAGAGVDVRNLRKWRKHPQAEPFLNEQIRGNLQQAQTLFAEAAVLFTLTLFLNLTASSVMRRFKETYE